MTPKELYNANLQGVSYGVLARKLGTTRSTMSGRINKYRIKTGGVTATEYKDGKRNNANGVKIFEKKKVPLVKPDKYEDYPHARAPKVNTKNLDQWLHSNTCRFLGSNYKVEEHQFCDAMPLRGNPYCEKHHVLTHQKKKIKDTDAIQRGDSPCRT